MMAFWLGLPPWARTALMWTGAILLCVITGKFIVAQHDARIRREMENEQAVESAKARAELVETSNREIQNVQDAKDAAVAAPHSLPEFGSADELRQQAPAIGRVILTHRGEDQPGS